MVEWGSGEFGFSQNLRHQIVAGPLHNCNLYRVALSGLLEPWPKPPRFTPVLPRISFTTGSSWKRFSASWSHVWLKQQLQNRARRSANSPLPPNSPQKNHHYSHRHNPSTALLLSKHRLRRTLLGSGLAIPNT